MELITACMVVRGRKRRRMENEGERKMEEEMQI